MLLPPRPGRALLVPASVGFHPLFTTRTPMTRRFVTGLMVRSLLLTGCASEPPTAGELTAFDAVCDHANDGKRVTVEGYLILPDEFTESSSVVMRLYKDLDAYFAESNAESATADGASTFPPAPRTS
jgi:hypothetical protein